MSIATQIVNDGAQAYRDGKPDTANPYYYGVPRWSLWLRGWMQEQKRQGGAM